jgi:hypothetical protein
MTILSLTTQAARVKAADMIAAKLREAAPAAVIAIEPGILDNRELTISATLDGVRSWTDLDGDSTWGAIVHWYIRGSDGPRFATRFAAMIGGSINEHHRQKATGPYADQGPKRGQVDADQFDNMVETWVEALRDMALGAEGGCFHEVVAA